MACLVAGASCTDRQAFPHGTTSLLVNITSPTDLGTPDHRLPHSLRSMNLEVQAIDDNGAVDTSFNGTVTVEAQYLGTVSDSGHVIQLVDGVGSSTVSLPDLFGPTYLWLEDTTDTSNGRVPTYATGTSQISWFPDPYLEDMELPDLTNNKTWLSATVLDGKQVTVTKSKHGATGKLVVTGVFVDGYGLDDVDCATKPCVADPFNHVYVYTYGRALDSAGIPIQIGQTMKSVGGGVGDFNGFTELNFPQQTLDNATPDESLLPTPVVIQNAWLSGPTTDTGEINMEKLESGLVELDNGTVCPLDADWDKYKQWKVDIGGGCHLPVNIISAGKVPLFDPTALVGMKVGKVIGNLRAVNIGTFNVWIVYPRRPTDIVP